MRAHARIVAKANGDGQTRLTVLRGEPPLLPRRTGPRWGQGSRPGPTEVHLVGGAAAPLGGDHLHLDIEVGPGAWLVARTVAAMVVLPGLSGAPSVSHIHASVANGARLEWLPEPVVAAAGCRHHGESTVDLAAGASLVWREEVVCGRTGEECGNLRLLTAVHLTDESGRRPLWQQELTIGPDAPSWAGPAVLGNARTTGSVLLVDPAWAPPGHAPTAATTITTAGTRLARMPLAGPALLTSAVAPDTHALRKALDHYTGHAVDGLASIHGLHDTFRQ